MRDAQNDIIAITTMQVVIGKKVRSEVIRLLRKSLFLWNNLIVMIILGLPLVSAGKYRKPSLYLRCLLLAKEGGETVRIQNSVVAGQDTIRLHDQKRRACPLSLSSRGKTPKKIGPSLWRKG
jgi:hypothetical protein